MDKVSSPGGSTIDGICVLSELGFEAAIVEAVEVCVQKNEELRQ
jgi:pyrroline-5-carboxylate reductase